MSIRPRLGAEVPELTTSTIPASTTASWATSASGSWGRGGRTGSLTWPWHG